MPDVSSQGDSRAVSSVATLRLTDKVLFEEFLLLVGLFDLLLVVVERFFDSRQDSLLKNHFCSLQIFSELLEVAEQLSFPIFDLFDIESDDFPRSEVDVQKERGVAIHVLILGSVETAVLVLERNHCVVVIL